MPLRNNDLGLPDPEPEPSTEQEKELFAAMAKVGSGRSDEEFVGMLGERLLVVSADWWDNLEPERKAEFTAVPAFVSDKFGRRVAVWQVADDWGGGKSGRELLPEVEG